MKTKITIASVLLTATLIIAGCNPSKKMMKKQQQYEAMVNDYNTRHPQRIDTSTIYLPGQTVTTETVKYDTVYTPYSDDTKIGVPVIKSILKTVIQKQFVHDTIKQTLYNTDAIHNLQNQLAAANARATEINNEKKGKNVWIYTTLLSVALLAVLIYVLAKNSFTNFNIK